MRHTLEGFRYDPSTVNDAGETISTISYGPMGQRILKGHALHVSQLWCTLATT